jgi:acyl carrier protein
MKPELLIGRVFGVSPGRIVESTSNRTLDEWDSLGHVALITELQTEYGVELSTEEVLSMTSVSAIKGVLGARGVTW